MSEADEAAAKDVMNQSRQLLSGGKLPAATDVLKQFLVQHPDHIKVTASLCMLLAMQGQGKVAQRRLEDLVKRWPDHASAHYCLGAYLVATGRKKAGITSLRRALELDPTDKEGAKFLLANAGAGEVPERASAEIAQMFDGYAHKFDTDLQDNLQYRVPEMIAAEIRKSPKTRAAMLDLGCGTGLCGVHLREHVTRMVGVDLSAKMIAKAEARNIYDALSVGEVLAYLKTSQEQFDLIVAADVLVYIANIPELFRAVAERMTPAGEFWFSVERAKGEGVKVAISRRYQHSSAYLRAAAEAAGLRVKAEQAIGIRMNQDAMLDGLLVALEHR